jgi:hypothetical protein
MSLILIDGLEDTSSWAVTGTAAIAAARNGNGFCPAAGTNRLNFTIPAAAESDTVTVGFAFQASAGWSQSSPLILSSDAGATVHLTMLLQTNGTVTFTRSGSTVATIATVIPAGTWVYIEVQAKLHDTTGLIAVRYDGVQVLASTSLDTKNAGTKTTFDRVVIGGASAGSTFKFDDLYIMAGAGDTFLGDLSVETLYPNGNGAANQWIGSDGNSTDNYLLVDESGAPNIADYVASATSGHQDLYTMTNLVRTTGTILGVCHQAHAIKTDSGARQMKIVNRRAADNKSAALDLTTSFAPYHYTLVNDPETGAPFTIGNVNSLQSGVEVV